MEIDVEIMSGAGNIFSIIDNRKLRLPTDFFQHYAAIICEKSYNKKTEGLLIIENAKNNEKDFSLKYFNPDGSSGMMCGNGSRCAVGFALNREIIVENKKIIKFEVWGKDYVAELIDDKIKITFPPPIQIILNKTIEINNLTINGDFINVNSPHYVINIDEQKLFANYDFFTFPVNDYGRAIRFHNEFFPEGTNVDFFKLQNDIIFLRTYERGVENETGACGTGAISTAISVYFAKKRQTTFRIVPTSREELIVEIIVEGNLIKNINLIGGYKFLGKSKLLIQD